MRRIPKKLQNEKATSKVLKVSFERHSENRRDGRFGNLVDKIVPKKRRKKAPAAIDGNNGHEVEIFVRVRLSEASFSLTPVYRRSIASPLDAVVRSHRRILDIRPEEAGLILVLLRSSPVVEISLTSTLTNKLGTGGVPRKTYQHEQRRQGCAV